MALVQKSNRKRTITLLLAFVGILVAGGAALWFINREPDVAIGDAGSRTQDLPILDSFGTDLLQSDRVLKLRPYGKIPVSAETQPNPNPFERRF